MAALPSYEADLFTDDALTEPYHHYSAIRDLGPVVRLDAHDLFAVARYDEVRRVLGDPQTFCSGEGVGLNDIVNQIGKGNTLMSDGALHRVQRSVIARPLRPKALAELQPELQRLADDIVDGLIERGGFDAVTDLAQYLPTRWVPDLLGWPIEARSHLLDWAAASFNSLGPANERCMAAVGGMREMFQFARDVAASGNLVEGSFAADVLKAAADGEITPEQCPAMLTAYLAPSLDTTISAIGNAIWLLASHPTQWTQLRADPSLVKNGFNEAVRLESPLSCFTRLATRSVNLSGAEIPQGARVLVMYASANRDGRRWERPDEFDITREVSAHLGFGYGEHACAGMGLARLEGNAVLSSLARKVTRIELGEPTRKLNNLIRSFASLPVTVFPN